MTIVTKTGDTGTTGLFGGERRSKDDARIEAYGTVDECNAVLGIVLIQPNMPDDARKQLLHLQHLLFRVGGDLATPMGKHEKQERMSAKHVEELEEWIQEIEPSLPTQMAFILPGGSSLSAHLHLARTVCRRAERRVVTLARQEEVNEHAQIFLNRLSDYLFVLARKMNADSSIEDTKVEY
jgi:cob(I)alamin adenosyltransferase